MLGLIKKKSECLSLKILSNIQGVIEMRDQILTTSYWLHVEFKKKYLKNTMSKNKMSFIF
jgi:hypothetical protein